jgi:hypothetical protein
VQSKHEESPFAMPSGVVAHKMAFAMTKRVPDFAANLSSLLEIVATATRQSAADLSSQQGSPRILGPRWDLRRRYGLRRRLELAGGSSA